MSDDKENPTKAEVAQALAETIGNFAVSEMVEGYDFAILIFAPPDEGQPMSGVIACTTDSDPDTMTKVLAVLRARIEAKKRGGSGEYKQ